MNNKIKIAIYGYGNLGKGIESEITKCDDMELVAIFTRRNPQLLSTNSAVPVLSINEIEQWKNKIDVMIMCGGSANDLPSQVPEVAKLFNTVDSFDTHAKIPEYFEMVNKNATFSKKVSVISGGWDPGIFSVMRTYFDAILPQGKTYTFWGKGVSQGHSNAIKKIPGVKNAVQYTIPIEEAINKVRNGESPNLLTSEKHIRECYVVTEDNADLQQIEQQIKTMPNYFDEYNTIVHFISEDELNLNHNSMPHGGLVIRSGNTGHINKHILEFSLKLDSNPEFTASILLSLARATYRMYESGQIGAKTILDIPPSLLSKKSSEELRQSLL